MRHQSRCPTSRRRGAAPPRGAAASDLQRPQICRCRGAAAAAVCAAAGRPVSYQQPRLAATAPTGPPAARARAAPAYISAQTSLLSHNLRLPRGYEWKGICRFCEYPSHHLHAIHPLVDRIAFDTLPSVLCLLFLPSHLRARDACGCGAPTRPAARPRVRRSTTPRACPSGAAPPPRRPSCD